MRAINGGFANFASPDNPARVYKRGQVVTIKYQRNNHGPGGFLRLTLVEPKHMMNKAMHAKNAFYYSCWGANPVPAKSTELGRDKYGFSFIGSDGEQHNHAKGYYVTNVKIPPVVPDGSYVLGWIWHGGIGDSVQGNAPQEPKPYGYFGDYHSCSYVQIKGGVALQRSYTPVFNNDMKQYSNEGCMSANDAPGVCVFEPCRVTGRYQKPRPFKDGKKPAPLTPENFGGKSPSGSTEKVDPKAGSGDPPSTGPHRRSTRCIAAGMRCWSQLASATQGGCRARTQYGAQPGACKMASCAYCKNRRRWKLCMNQNIKAVCGY